MSSDSFVGSIMASIGRVCRLRAIIKRSVILITLCVAIASYSCPMDRMIFRSKRLIVALAVVIRVEDTSIRSIEPEERF
jgi:hypothetical protein